MKLKPTRAQLVFLGLFIGIGIILTSFQNCGTQDYSDSLAMPSSPLVDASNADGIPFAFDYRVNQITYMSCSRSKDKVGSLQSSTTHLNDPNIFFTFKVGSYANGVNTSNGPGLTFRKEFIDHVIAKFANKGVLSDENIKNAITKATAHGGAAVQFAIRESTPIASSIIKLSPEPTPGVDFDLTPKKLTLDNKEFLESQLLKLFKKPLPRLTILGTSTLQTYRLEGALHFGSLTTYDEPTAQLLRDELESNGALSKVLAVTYSKDLTDVENQKTSYIARSAGSADSDNRVWGTGFNLAFQSATNGKRWKNNILASVVESDLATFNSPATSPWSCSDQLRYVIVSPKDSGPGGAYPCKDPVNVSNLTAQQASNLAILQRHLSPSEWIIDPEMECVTPRKTTVDCYGNRAFNTIDYYGSTSQCGLDDNGVYQHRDCAEYVSVCLRN